MVNKAIIAHELGHAIAGIVQDTFYYPCDIELHPGKGQLACCNFDEGDRIPMSPYGKKFKFLSDLGGLYGELILNGNWHAWGARADLDSFNSENENKVSELDSWLWIDDDDLSFRACSSYPTVQERRKFVLDSHETYRRLPILWESYCDFCDYIDKDEFRAVVALIVKEKPESINKATIKKYAKRIIL